jgi:hypothetical protein
MWYLLTLMLGGCIGFLTAALFAAARDDRP